MSEEEEIIKRKDVLNAVQDLRRDFASHKKQDEDQDRRIVENKQAFDRHLEIYAANGKESARVATNLENLIKTVDEVKNIVSNREVKSDGQNIDVAKIQLDVDWLKRFFWIVVTASIGSIVTAVFTAILTLK